jgi:dimethylaniline monooxygenase (N-oxide forming)
MTLVTDPALWWQLLTGPITSYQMRLSGPGKWQEARQAIMEQRARLEQPLREAARLPASSRLSPSYLSMRWALPCLVLLLAGALIAVLFSAFLCN